MEIQLNFIFLVFLIFNHLACFGSARTVNSFPTACSEKCSFRSLAWPRETPKKSHKKSMPSRDFQLHSLGSKGWSFLRSPALAKWTWIFPDWLVIMKVCYEIGREGEDLYWEKVKVVRLKKEFVSISRKCKNNCNMSQFFFPTFLAK